MCNSFDLLRKIYAGHYQGDREHEKECKDLDRLTIEK